MRKLILALPLIASVVLWNSIPLLAGEHGGTTVKEHGGEAMEGSHGMTEDHAATLKEAARILKQEGHADLAQKLEDLARM